MSSSLKTVKALSKADTQTGGGLSNVIEWLPVANLRFDPVYNRDVQEPKVAKIAAQFDPDYIGTITVSFRGDGTYVVVDGQHRVRAMRLMGWDDQMVECRIYSGLTVADEARLFGGLNDMTKPAAIDLFRARVVEGEPVACGVNSVLQEVGLTFSSGAGPSKISAVRATEKVYLGKMSRSSGPCPDQLRSTLQILLSAYGHESTSVAAVLVEGVALVLGAYPRTVDVPALIRGLASVPGGAHGLIASGKSLQGFRGGNVPNGIAEVIVGLYNKKRRTGALPDWRTA